VVVVAAAAAAAAARTADEDECDAVAAADSKWLTPETAISGVSIVQGIEVDRCQSTTAASRRRRTSVGKATHVSCNSPRAN